MSLYPLLQPEALPQHMDGTVRLQGMIYKIRHMSGFAFVLLRMRRVVVQCTYVPDTAAFPLESICEGAWVTFTGLVVAEARSKTGYEVRLLAADVLSRPVVEAPAVINSASSDIGLEGQLNNRPFVLRNVQQRAIFAIQASITAAFRAFLDGEQFTEIHTPKIISTGAEGGANIFALDYFGHPAFLAQSPQCYKQMMVGVFERVYEVGPVFRAEQHDTARHLNEYTSLDLEMGFIEGFEDVCALENALLVYMMAYLQEHNAPELQLLNARLPEPGSIPYIRFMDAKALLEKQRPVTDWQDFDPEEERLLCKIMRKQTGSEFVFVTHYPSAKRPFYAMDDPQDTQVTLSFDLLFRGLEITTGGQRIHEYAPQVAKMAAWGLHPEAFASYLQIHQTGMPPHGGLGLGLERLTMQLLGLPNIRQTCLFPRDIGRLEP